MSALVPASELNAIQEGDIRDAIKNLSEGRFPQTFQESTRFDLLVDGNRRYPPKAVIALAAKRPLGRVLSSDELQGGERSTAFRLLLRRGFAFATKLRRVGVLDATFSVGRDRKTRFVLIESRGPDRNNDYSDGLEVLLRGLSSFDATIDDVMIDSAETRQLPVEQRRLKLRHYTYPLRLRGVDDVSALRRDITRTAAGTARGAHAAGGGNSTKRLRLVFTEPSGAELWKVAGSLAQDRGVVVALRRFVFRPRPPTPGGGGRSTRKAMDEAVVTHLHYEMQQSLYDSLVIAHGEQHVSCEGTTCSGRPADIILRLPDGYELFEIKTALEPIDCVQEALGQLLEYAYWPGSPAVRALWVVGLSPSDAATQEHLDGLRERFGIPVDYRQQPVVSPSSQARSRSKALTEAHRQYPAASERCDRQFKVVFDAIRELIRPAVNCRRPIGFL